MTTSTLAFGKASASGALRLAKQSANFYSTAPAPAQGNGNGAHSKPADAATQRELFMNVLNANATKRDAKQYLARFKNQKTGSPKISPLQQERNARHRNDQDRLDRIGVNLGALYTPARAIAETPKFSQHHIQEKAELAIEDEFHVALVCLRDPESLADSVLDGVALTLSQLVKLDMKLIVVLDRGNGTHNAENPERSSKKLKQTRHWFSEQGERLSRAVSRHSPEGARLITGAMEIADSRSAPSKFDTEKVAVSLPNLIMDPLRRAIVPILPTLAYTSSGQTEITSVSSVMSALTYMLSGLPDAQSGYDASGPVFNTSIDRVIVLDSIGGIPSRVRGDGAHIFINLEQEFDDIQVELSQYDRQVDPSSNAHAVYAQHEANLRMVQRCLALSPSSTSALIVTPQEVASSAQATEELTIGTGTRKQKNTLIHNLLTNKPVVSSSLPVARLPATSDANGDLIAVDSPRSTLLKRGMPLTMIPAADRTLGWQVPTSGVTPLSLEHDPRIDLSRLVHLIEDSFRRKLDLQHYLERVQNRLAGLIVAGEYEGGAILTWEMPTGTSDPTRLVPYLDKFAVLASSQGSSGVADILFQAMVRSCFPQGVCWRSRKDNPVNKWYFERADGHWQIPETNWTMFWTGKGVAEDTQRWWDYVSVCRDVGPSWADGKKPD